ncbi:MAG: hypothetical protein AAGI53_03335 [Planctomycetota bacterium]
MHTPELSFAVAALGLVCLLIAFPPLLKTSAPHARRAMIAAASATPIVTLVGGAIWIALTTSPIHLKAFVDQRFPAASSAVTHVAQATIAARFD